jgi:branched-chain amino acid transport system ATP-binding protein
MVVENTVEVISRIRDTGVSVLMVEQHAEMTLEIVDHAYILELGRIVADGPASRLATDPRVREAYLSL